VRFAFDDAIAAQPDALRRALALDLGGARLDPSRPIVFTGLGSSLHACRVAAAWTSILSAGRVRAHAIDPTSLIATAADQIIVVSHSGRSLVPSPMIVVCGDHAQPTNATHVLRTGPAEQANTHSRSYVCALAILGRLLDDPTLNAALTDAPAAIERILSEPPPVADAARLAGREPILVAGSGALAAITASEIALKIKEGTCRWAEGMFAEQALHGPQLALRPGAGAILLGDPAPELARTLAARSIETLTLASTADSLAAPLIDVVRAQRLVAEMARLLGTNPDKP
jgi:glucosamine--fructose-6-phosphate aminotransferase (isomerizing)